MPADAPLRGDPERNAAWRGFLKHGETRGFEMSQEYRNNISGSQNLSATLGSAGGYFVPIGYHSELIQSLPMFDEILSPDFANQFDDATGNPQAIPAIDDLIGSPLTFNKSTIVGEGSQSTQSDVIASSAAFPTTPQFRSGRMFFSFELIEDSPILGAALQMAIARRHAIGIGGYFITGTGSASQPQGLTSSLPTSTVITSASSTLSLADFEAVYAAISPSYIKESVWYMSDATRALVTKLLEAAGRPMIGPVNELLRRPIAVCNSMTPATAGASAVAVLANKNYIYQRFIPQATAILRYVQAAGYAEYGLIGVEGAHLKTGCMASAVAVIAGGNLPE